jgi:hypothetical protein
MLIPIFQLTTKSNPTTPQNPIPLISCPIWGVYFFVPEDASKTILKPVGSLRKLQLKYISTDAQETFVALRY